MSTNDLERRYARWAALFYPAGYRRERGSELVGTYLALAAPGRRRPSFADVADLASGGVQQHLRITQSLRPGFRLAGLLALMTATALAAGWAILEVHETPPPWTSPAGPFLTLGIAAWVAWLLVAVVHAAAPARWFRWAAGFALLVTAAVVPASMLTGLSRPPLSVLLPQLVLGLVALGAGGRRPWWVRLLPFAAAAVTAPLAAIAPDPEYFGGYYWVSGTALPAAAVLLLVGALLLALGLAARRDNRGLWALLILLTPIGMLATNPLGALFDNSGPGHPVIPAWSSMVVASILVVVVGPALVPLAVAARGRLSPIPRPRHGGTDTCPACGAPKT